MLTAVSDMLINRHKFFRWTPRTAWITIAYVLIVPGIFFEIGRRTEGKYSFRGKRRGDTIVEW